MVKQNQPVNETVVSKEQTSTGIDEVRINRLIDAPRELVFRAWTETVFLQEWYAPDGCTLLIKNLDYREGGEFHHCIQSPGHHDCWCRGTYLRIEKPSKLVYSLRVCDEQGALIDPVTAGMDPGWPAETIVTVQFMEEGNKTRILLHQTVNEALAKRTGAYPSWLLMLDRLEKLVS